MDDKTHKKTSADERQFFVSTRMSLPLFMVSRNRLREDQLDNVKQHLKLAGTHYNIHCQQENRGEEFSAATYAHYRHVTGFDKAPEHPYPEKRPLRSNRAMTTWRGYHHAPNRYGVLPVPYKSKMGSKGSIFSKIHAHKSRVSIKLPSPVFYETPSEIDRLFRPENKQKGIFLSNARERRATTRFMVDNLTTCWRNPDDPGPTDTNVDKYEINKTMIPKRKTVAENPHIFLPLSCVPAKPSKLVPKNISFTPGPGRYDIRYPNAIPCVKGKTTMPRLRVLLEAQKRYKFRHLPYQRLNFRKYCEPDWSHVEGNGHQYRFRMGKKDLPKPQVKKAKGKKEKTEKTLKMFADGKYLNMLVNPKRYPISIRDFEIVPYTPRIVYNCIAKRVVRKQLRNNKKIAFMSGQERWKDGARVIVFTSKQLEEIKARLPEERRLYDHSIVLRESQMVSRLSHVPEHLRNTYMPKLRKRLFKFSPIPGARVLVTDSDIRPDMKFDRENPSGMYNRPVDVSKFFRDSVLFEMEQQTLGIKAEEKTNADAASLSSGSVYSKVSNPSIVKNSESHSASKANAVLLNPDEVDPAAT